MSLSLARSLSLSECVQAQEYNVVAQHRRDTVDHSPPKQKQTTNFPYNVRGFVHLFQGRVLNRNIN